MAQRARASSRGRWCSPRLVDGRATIVRPAPGTGVAAVVEEASYADLPLLLRDVLPERSGLPAFFNPGVFLAVKLFLDLDPWAVRPKEETEELSKEGVPLLIVHSLDDEVVPFEHAELFAASYPERSDPSILNIFKHTLGPLDSSDPDDGLRDEGPVDRTFLSDLQEIRPLLVA